MKFLIKSTLVFLFLALFLFKLPNSSFASEEFIISHNVTYEALSNGSFQATAQVSLTNKLSRVYATQYSLSFDKVKPQNVRAFDDNGPLRVETVTQGEQTQLNFNFNQQVAGKDKTYTFAVIYEVSQLLNQSGQVREIAIPKLERPEQIDNYSLTLKVPSSFGRPAFISPNPKGQKLEEDNQFFYFDKDQASSSNIIAAFGEFQVFNFSLNYHLSNPTSTNLTTQIALPPDTAYQKLSYGLIDPKPLNIEVDQDGNWLGTYKLKPREKIKIVAQGQAKIFANPQGSFTTSFIQPQEGLNDYLKPQKYWETNNAEIISLAQQLKTPKAIYDYVIKSLDYDYSRVRKGVERLGGFEALKTQRAICMEYTDLFVALARAAGIPARENNGFAYTTNPSLQPLSLVQDVLHAWPEYWDADKKTWVQVDPTWQDTTNGEIDYFSKLDLGHFTFAIHGLNSQYPIPAGSYKEIGNLAEQKDVEITVGQYKEPKPSSVEVAFLVPGKILAEIATNGKIRVTNTGTEAIYNLKLDIIPQNFKVLSERNPVIAVLPPFSSQEIPIKLAPQKFLSSGLGKIMVFANNQQFEQTLTYDSILFKRVLPILGALLFLLAIAFFGKRIWIKIRKI